jgi:FKBP-type peptidyl-prolyl cis-trans isomerase
MSRWSRLSRHLPMRTPQVTGESAFTVVADTPGDGAQAWPGQTLRVHVAAWHVDGRPLELPSLTGETHLVLGGGTMIRGLEHALRGMRVGGLRRVELPPALAFGARGASGSVPPGATLVLEIRLLAAAPTPPPRVG